VLKLSQLIGEFEKPKFFVYKEKLCAHSRSGKLGCNACLDVCSTDAISAAGDKVSVNQIYVPDAVPAPRSVLPVR
jgi:ferredoxin